MSPTSILHSPPRRPASTMRPHFSKLSQAARPIALLQTRPIPPPEGVACTRVFVHSLMYSSYTISKFTVSVSTRTLRRAAEMRRAVSISESEGRRSIFERGGKRDDVNAAAAGKGTVDVRAVRGRRAALKMGATVLVVL